MREQAGTNPLSRREMLGLGAAAALGWPALRALGAEAAAGGRKRVLRIAHLTDMHVQPEKQAGEGLAACLHHVQRQKDAPDVIFTGGDTVMDSIEQDEARTKLQWELWQRVMKAECSLPVKSCLGNHDAWGLNKKKSKTTGTEALYGKKWAQEVFGLARPYYSFDQAGWHIVVLDSTFPQEAGYTAKLDEEQFGWLGDDLKGVSPKTPILVMSHIPILAACTFFDGDNEKSGNWQVPGAWMHIDARRIKDLFRQYPNVRACISGHIHLVDRVDYLGVTYYCNGAVCGGWWNGDHQECTTGYGMVNLYDDGSHDCAYVPYEWKYATA